MKADESKIDKQTARLKLMQYDIAPLIGQYLQPKGTRGRDALWGTDRRWPGTQLASSAGEV